MNDPSECAGWRSVATLFTQEGPADIAFIGAPQAEKSLTPGRCDLAPAALRAALRRFSVYDLETETDLSALRVRDAGDLPLKLKTPEAALAPIRDAARAAPEALVVICGGNNAVTRPCVHALGDDLSKVGLITLDAHFDLRDTDCGLNNGNPIKALVEDGLPGPNIVQIGLQPFANSRRMHETARAAGITVFTASDCARTSAPALFEEALVMLSHLDAVHVDFDIDVIDRAQMPAAPGARPGGVPIRDFFAIARLAGRRDAVRSVDLSEFDPALDVSDIGALAAGRWFCEILAGFAARRGT